MSGGASFETEFNEIEEKAAAVCASIPSGEICPDLLSDLGISMAGVTPSERKILEIAFSEVQIRSKLWLLERLFTHVATEDPVILVLGGWCGVLPWLAGLTGKGLGADWRSLDIDPEACALGAKLFGKSVPNMSFKCQDIYAIDYETVGAERELVVINTVCEHLSELPRWRGLIPRGVLTVLQSNNFRGCPDHVNCVDSEEELGNKAMLDQVSFMGSLKLSLFTRFMVIGRS